MTRKATFCCGWTRAVAFGAALVAAGLSEPASAQQLKGKVKVDGSSTVAPITMAAAELFQAEQPRVRVTVGISGTGGASRSSWILDRIRGPTSTTHHGRSRPRK